MSHLVGDDVTAQPSRYLVDYFWIAGLAPQELFSQPYNQELSNAASSNTTSASTVDTINENDEPYKFKDGSIAVSHGRQGSREVSNGSPRLARTSLQTSAYSTRSSTSQATVRRVASHDHDQSLLASSRRLSRNYRRGDCGKDVDFEKALRDFAQDRDAFYVNMSFDSSSINSPARQQVSEVRSRTHKIIVEDSDPSTMSNTFESVRRHMSLRDVNKPRKQHSVMRKATQYSSRRQSTYQSVMPNPQPHQEDLNKHPLKRSFAPTLLDRYPYRRSSNPFPSYVPMFAFPHDTQIISSDSRPATTWHEFLMTSSENQTLSAVCVIIWVPLDDDLASAVERECEDWRRAHMSDAERELATSLGERLADERATLSRLLAMLPNIEQGSKLREDLEDDISMTEEKIGLMADMLKPLRHAACARIRGLTDGETGLWMPRAYGTISQHPYASSFLKEWLKAVVLPMMDSCVVGVPPSSPRIGFWQPLERYVYTICNIKIPLRSSKLQIEVAIRELGMYYRNDARNEIPGSRNIDFYPLFRCLTTANIVVLLEYILCESRIILVSSNVTTLKATSDAILALLWPLTWTGVLIPVVPDRLMEVLEAPVPYICGVVQKDEILNLPQDNDFVLVDLDKNELHATAYAPILPKQQRRKLLGLLYLSASHHQTRGVAVGPPDYMREAYPNDRFVSEHSSVFTPFARSTNLASLTAVSSSQFGDEVEATRLPPVSILNAFAQAKSVSSAQQIRPKTAATTKMRRPSQTGSDASSSGTAVQRGKSSSSQAQSQSHSAIALQASLREKRSGMLNSASTLSMNSNNMRHKQSVPFVRHNSNLSQSNKTTYAASIYAPSAYSQNTMAASTIMPSVTPWQAVQDSASTTWREGHCMRYREALTGTLCSICGVSESESRIYRCNDCPLQAHTTCLVGICLPCPAAFNPDKIRAAFARFFTSLFYNYRRYMISPTQSQIKADPSLHQKLDVDSWIRSLPSEHAEYLSVLRATQAFDVFVHQRETRNPDPNVADQIALFDALVSVKRSRAKNVRSSIIMGLHGRNPFSSSNGTSQAGNTDKISAAAYLADTSRQPWQTISTVTPEQSQRASISTSAAKDRDYKTIVTRAPERLEDDLFPTQLAPGVENPDITKQELARKTDGKELPEQENQQDHTPGEQREQQGRQEKQKRELKTKKSLRSRMNGLSMHAPNQVLPRFEDLE